MPPEPASKSTLGACADLPLEAQLEANGGAGRIAIAARLTAEIDAMSGALLTASPELKKELTLLVECLRAARQVVDRSSSFKNARE